MRKLLMLSFLLPVVAMAQPGHSVYDAVQRMNRGQAEHFFGSVVIAGMKHQQPNYVCRAFDYKALDRQGDNVIYGVRCEGGEKFILTFEGREGNVTSCTLEERLDPSVAIVCRMF